MLVQLFNPLLLLLSSIRYSRHLVLLCNPMSYFRTVYPLVPNRTSVSLFHPTSWAAQSGLLILRCRNVPLAVKAFPCLPENTTAVNVARFSVTGAATPRHSCKTVLEHPAMRVLTRILYSEGVKQTR